MLFFIAATTTKPSTNSAGSFIVLAVIVVAFILLWRNFMKPKQRQAQAQRDILLTLEPGDEVLTGAGIFGTIQHVQGDRVTLWTGTGSTITVLKRTIAQKITDDDMADHDDENHDGLEDDAAHDSDPNGVQVQSGADENTQDVHEDPLDKSGTSSNGQVGGPVGDRTSPENKAEEDDR
jgi:preprotein translocase subunit YajC